MSFKKYIPNFRKTDPITSQLAGKDVVASGRALAQRQEVFEAVRLHPHKTSREIADILGIDRYTPARRLPELERDGEVVRGAARKCTVGGRLSVTWHVPHPFA